MISAVYDACVLYSASLRDFLLWLGYVRAVRPLWSEEIHEEWMRSLLKKRPALLQKLKRTRQEMDTKFPRSLVIGFEDIIPSLRLPDPKDRHVLAVAVHAKAEYIVTFNLNDFPKTVLHPYGIEALSPDGFVQRLLLENSHSVLEAAKNHRLRLKNPPKTVEEYLATLEKQGLPQTVAFLREHENEV